MSTTRQKKDPTQKDKAATDQINARAPTATPAKRSSRVLAPRNENPGSQGSSSTPGKTIVPDPRLQTTITSPEKLTGLLSVNETIFDRMERRAKDQAKSVERSQCEDIIQQIMQNKYIRPWLQTDESGLLIIKKVIKEKSSEQKDKGDEHAVPGLGLFAVMLSDAILDAQRGVFLRLFFTKRDPDSHCLLFALKSLLYQLLRQFNTPIRKDEIASQPLPLHFCSTFLHLCPNTPYTIFIIIHGLGYYKDPNESRYVVQLLRELTYRSNVKAILTQPTGVEFTDSGTNEHHVEISEGDGNYKEAELEELSKDMVEVLRGH